MSELYRSDAHDTSQDDLDAAPDLDTRETDTGRQPEATRDPIDTDPGYYDDPDVTLTEEEGDREFQTRQEAADEDRDWDGRDWDDTTDLGNEHDGDGDAESPGAERDSDPDTQIRHEATDEDAALVKNASETGLDRPRATSGDGRDPAPRVDSTVEDSGSALDERPAQEDINRWHEMYQEYRQEQEPADHGWGEGTNVVGEKPGRSPGDTSDLPPTGEELLSMEGDRESRLTRLRRETESPETFDNLQDSLEKNVNLAHDAFQRPEPTGSHTEVPHQPEFTAPPHQATDAGQIAVAGLVVGVLGVELFRWVRHKVSPLKGDAHGSNR
jgi:hypothetical protein